MKRRYCLYNRIGILVVFILFFLTAPIEILAAGGCRTGASALGNAFVRVNPIYAYFYGSLESYVEENREHFVAGGDSILCARVLSQALMSGAIKSYDHDDFRRQRELDAKMSAMGLSPGPYQPTASQRLYTMALQLNRLIRVLPPAANGNYKPLYTPTTELEQMQIFGEQMMATLLQDPSVAETFQQLEPMIKESANLEYQILVNMANNLD